MSDYDWEVIRLRWEGGESGHSIARDEGMPRPQSISRKARECNWTRTLASVPDRSIDVAESVLAELSPTQQQVARYISEGLTQKDAARLSGVAAETVSVWKKTSPKYAQAHQLAVGIKNLNRVSKVENSTDTKDQRWLLERDPDSRADYGSMGGTFVGHNTVNILGGIDVGFSLDHNGVSEGRDDAITPVDGRLGHES